jgi:hypothetical protein
MECRKMGVLVVLSLCVFGSAVAARSSTTNDFIRSCGVPVPSEDCIEEFLLSAAANKNWGGGAKHKFCLPEIFGLEQEEMYAEARKQIRNIVSWLNTHPELGRKDPTEPIGAAAEAKYPCK